MAAIISAFPILLLFILIMGLKLSGWKGALITLVVTIVLAVYAVPSIGVLPAKYAESSIYAVTMWSVVEGLLKACFPIIMIIIFAIFSHNVLHESKEIETIKSQFAQLTSDRGLLVLLLTWGFGGVLEGMAGFGTAVAIPAAVLISLGFKPMFSAVVSLIANTVAVGFGAVGLPTITLVNQVTDNIVAPETYCEISAFIVVQLTLLFYITPFLILMMTDSKRVGKNLSISLFVGTVSLVAQFCCACFLGPETPAILGSVAAILSMLAYNKLFIPKDNQQDAIIVKKQKFGLTKTLSAWSVYGLIIFFVLVTSKLVPPVNELLKTTLVSQFDIPVVGTTFTFGWLSNAGLMILLGAFIGGKIQGLSFRQLLLLLAKTTLHLQKSMVSILCLVVIAVVMNNTGMTLAIATGLVAVTGPVYPLFAPFIGGIGTFVTGNATSTNILFGKLQAVAAGQLDLYHSGHFCGLSGNETNWVAAANSAGAQGGKMISPQSIAIATAACNMEGKDGDIMRRTLPFTCFWVLMNGLMVFLGLYLV